MTKSTNKTSRDCPVRIAIRVPSRHALDDVLAEIEKTEAEVVTMNQGCQEGREMLSIDVSALTDTQWETLQTAYEMGYYRQDREVGLDEIAELFEVSKSAISQRLRGAEKKLVAAMMEGAPCCGGMDETSTAEPILPAYSD